VPSRWTCEGRSAREAEIRPVICVEAASRARTCQPFESRQTKTPLRPEASAEGLPCAACAQLAGQLDAVRAGLASGTATSAAIEAIVTEAARTRRLLMEGMVP